MPEIGAWDSFYVIVGSAAGALIGLQFVVMTLLASSPTQPSAEAGAVYATPTILHFCAVLFLSAAIRAPWPTVAPIAALWGVVGVSGLLYALITTWRMWRQLAYRPALEDWVFHAALPLAAYCALLSAGVGAVTRWPVAPFGAGAGVLTLLFVGIHNSWDGVVYHVFVNLPKARALENSSAEKDGS
jgi:hypothetical protein